MNWTWDFGFLPIRSELDIWTHFFIPSWMVLTFCSVFYAKFEKVKNFLIGQRVVFSALVYVAILSVLWEVKDALWSWDKTMPNYAWWGGDGFSFKDLFFDALGITLAGLFEHWRE